VLQTQLFGTPELLRNSLSASGLPGLIHVPTATTVPEGNLDVGYNVTRDPKVFPGVNQQKNFNFAFGFLPRLALGGCGTDARNTDTGTQIAGDISANAHLLLLEDKSWRPGVDGGLEDIGGGQPSSAQAT
jgi:Exopolysaccharide biosynthesis protein YbjH